MENQTDEGRRLQRVLDLLGVNPHQMAQRLGYKSHASVYHVVDGRNSLSEGMIDRIVREFPRVNYNYLKAGEEPVLLDDHLMQVQMSHFNVVPKDASEYFAFKRFLDIPDQLDRIEQKLDRLLRLND